MELENKTTETVGESREQVIKEEPKPPALPSEEGKTEAAPEQARETGVKEAEQVLESKGLDLSVFEKEYGANGGLSEESYAALEGKGISRAVADRYIAGQQAIQAAVMKDVHSSVGGEDTFNKVVAWASENLNDKEKEAYNKVASGGDPAAVKLALSGIYAKYTAALGQEPSKRLEGGGVPGASGYASMAEVVRDMKDPRYQKDEAYRKQVKEKLAKSVF